MAVLHPFRALRPRNDVVKEVACVPYDVINTEEARRLADGNPLSFLHVIRPEIDLAVGISEYADAVYETGAANLNAYRESDSSTQDAEPGLFAYRLIMDGRAQTGIFGCVSVDDYDADVILKHERTLQSKEDDRTRHLLTQRAHAEPVMLTFRLTQEIGQIIEAARAGEPLYDFEADDGVRHTIWRVDDADSLVAEFERLDHLYVADGHHRCKAASRAAEALRHGERPGSAEFEFFPAVLFPMEEMQILAYNRIVYSLEGDAADFMEEMRKQFDVVSGVDPMPESKSDVCFYIDGQWHRLTLPDSRRGTIADSLDVARLSEFILEPLLGIDDPRTDENIDFVGGIRGTDELERIVDSGKAQVAFSMYPTRVEELVGVSDEGLLMPPKSTWFEPKLRSGLLVHLFE